MTKEALIRLWSDPAHWRGGLYRCAEDSRVIVPKRIPTAGWTVNFAHPLAVWAVLLAVIIAVGPTLLLLAAGVRNVGAIQAALAASITVLIAGSYTLSGRTHPQALPGILLGVALIVIPVSWLCSSGIRNPIYYAGVIAVSLTVVWLLGRGMQPK